MFSSFLCSLIVARYFQFIEKRSKVENGRATDDNITSKLFVDKMNCSSLFVSNATDDEHNHGAAVAAINDAANIFQIVPQFSFDQIWSCDFILIFATVKCFTCN